MQRCKQFKTHKKSLYNSLKIDNKNQNVNNEKITSILNNLTKDEIVKWSKTPTKSNIKFLNGTLPWSLDVIYLDLTSDCNYECIHCYTKTENIHKSYLKINPTELISLLSSLGVINIIITGGEPFLHGKIMSYLGEISEKNITFSIYTNGSLLNSFDLNFIASLNPEYIAISLDSLDKKKYEYIRGKNKLNSVINNIDSLISHDIKIRLNITLFKGINDGYDEIEKIIKFSKERNIDNLIFDTIIPVGEGTKIKKHYCDHSVVDKVKKSLKKSSLAEDISCNNLKDTGIKDISSINPSLLGKSFCGVGTHCASILADGNISPCPVLREQKYIAGNIMKNNLENLWLCSNVFSPFRKATPEDVEECKNCEFISWCKGGCKAKALIYHDTLSARDDWICKYYGKL